MLNKVLISNSEDVTLKVKTMDIFDLINRHLGKMFSAAFNAQKKYLDKQPLEVPFPVSAQMVLIN